MPKLLLSASTRLILALCTGLNGLALKTLDSRLDHAGGPVRFVLASLCGIIVVILFLDMANYGYSAVKLNQYPPLGLKYTPSFIPVRRYTGKAAVVRGSMVLFLGATLTILVAVALMSFWSS